MNNRISFIRKHENLNQQEFADRLNLTKNFISLLETGGRTPSDRTISDICREFGVDRVWLTEGIGEPFRPVDRNQHIAAVLGSAISHNGTARDRLIRAFSQLPDEMYEHAEKILEEIVENLQKEKE